MTLNGTRRTKECGGNGVRPNVIRLYRVESGPTVFARGSPMKDRRHGRELDGNLDKRARSVKAR